MEIVRLAIPGLYRAEKIIEAEIKRPDGGTLAAAKKALDDFSVVHGMIEYISGSVEKYIESSGKEYISSIDIKSITQKMPLQTIEQLAALIMAQLYPGEYVQGIYECPIYGCKDKSGSQTKIKISKQNDNSISFDHLNIEYKDNTPIDFRLMHPIMIGNDQGNVIIGGQKLLFSIPNVSDYISGLKKYPGNTNYQYYDMMLNCLLSIDGKDVDKETIRDFGLVWIKKIDGNDIQEILDIMWEGGIQKNINLVCPSCYEEFTRPIDLSSFFVSGLSRK